MFLRLLQTSSWIARRLTTETPRARPVYVYFTLLHPFASCLSLADLLDILVSSTSDVPARPLEIVTGRGRPLYPPLN